ncbi:hypothetical protein IGI04_042809, partial [Brassica rapa subsp. trilocularis]
MHRIITSLAPSSLGSKLEGDFYKDHQPDQVSGVSRQEAVQSSLGEYHCLSLTKDVPGQFLASLRWLRSLLRGGDSNRFHEEVKLRGEAPLYLFIDQSRCMVVAAFLFTATASLSDMIMDQLVDKDEEGETEDTLAEEEAVLAIPTGPITRAMTRRLKEAEAMGSEEDDETFVRRNRLLQEAITKQVMEAMVKLLEEKYDQRPHDGQGQASGSRHEQRRNRQGQREHAGSEETDNFYERSSHSSGSRRS